MNTMAAMGTKVKTVQGTSAPPPQAAPTPHPVTTPMRMSGVGGITSTTIPAVLTLYCIGIIWCTSGGAMRRLGPTTITGAGNFFTLT